MSLVLAGRLPCVALLLVIAGGPTLVAEPRDSELCRALVEHAAQMRAVDATAVEKVRQRWDSRDAAFDAGQFVPEALALLDADFAAAYEAFKSGDFATSASAFATLGESGDPYVAVNALHFQARSLVECDQVETATRLLAEAVPRGPHLAEFSPFVPRLYLQYALCETLQGQVAPAAAVLRKLERDFPDAPVNAHADTAEMLAGLEHARFQPLSQVANLMTNVTARLRTAEAGDDVQD
ncbi:MAG: hypothetical protein JXO22_14850, partial [Phycisphaerae bacterium]|nr:hypothetical protein [Phycisphaerae bacterium]